MALIHTLAKNTPLTAHINTHRPYEHCLWLYRHWSGSKRLVTGSGNFQIMQAKLGKMKRINDWFQLLIQVNHPNNSRKIIREQHLYVLDCLSSVNYNYNK